MAGKKTARAELWLIAVFWFLAVLALAVAGMADRIHSRVAAAETLDYLNLRDALTWMAAVLGASALALSVFYVLMHVAEIRQSSSYMVDDIRRIISSQTSAEAILTQINENQLLSDQLKAVAFREKDRAVLQDAIQEDIRMGSFESAEVLIRELENRFGSREQAQNLRQQLIQARSATTQENIEAALKHLESLWIIHHYADAQRLEDQLLRLYPARPEVQNLKGQSQKRREDHKKELLSRWDKAVKSDDIDQSIELLKLLDEYLTPTEGAALEETARGVFRKKLQNMGIEFTLYVTEKKWAQALKIGRTIIEEYPNSRMAQEVREKIGVLEQRAAQATV